MAWLFVPAAVVSNSDSTSPSPATELWVTLSGKPTQRPLSSPIWRSRPWVRLLSGTTLPPSTADRGVESWISSLAATRASRSAPPGSDSETPTPGTCGLTSLASSLRSSRSGVSSRTSQTTLTLDFPPSATTYRQWATALRRDCTRRLKLGRLRNASASTSWPTATLNVRGGWQQDPRTGVRTLTLAGASRAWNTPLASDDGQKVSPGSTRDSLMRQAKAWGTPTVGTAGGLGQEQPTRGARLQDQARNWPTPAASMPNDGEALASWEARRDVEREKGQNGNGMGTPLAIAALQWNTPMAKDAGKRSGGKRKGDDLTTQTEMWPAPAARDYRAPNADSYQDRTGTSKGEQLPNFVEHRFRPSARTAPLGEPSSSTARTSPRRLNPAFVEWLMGWPEGWAVAGTTSCGCSEMEWSRWQQLMGSLLCSLEWLRADAA